MQLAGATGIVPHFWQELWESNPRQRFWRPPLYHLTKLLYSSNLTTEFGSLSETDSWCPNAGCWRQPLLTLFVGRLFLAVLAKFPQLQSGDGIGFVFLGIVIALFTLATFKRNRRSGGFLSHLEYLLYMTNMS